MKSVFVGVLGLFSLALVAETPIEYAHTIGKKHLLYSEVLREEREVYVYLPKGFCGISILGLMALLNLGERTCLT